MIGIIVRGLTHLKILAPVMQELKALGQPYIVFFHDASHGDKEYDRPTVAKITEAHAASIKGAAKLVPFANDGKLVSAMVANKVNKMVGIEVGMWIRKQAKEIKKKNIKIYNVMYLTDSIWQGAENITVADRVYYTTEYIMSIHHNFSGVKFNPTRDRCLGSPVFDHLYTQEDQKTNSVLVLLPNLKAEHVKSAFGKSTNFFKIIERIHASGRPLIFKTRKKQWFPAEIAKYSKNVVYDGKTMYPPAISGLLKTCSTTVMFYSSGIFEAIYGQNYVVNIPLPLKRWFWGGDKMKKYFSTAPDTIYNFNGCVESVDQVTAMSGQWSLPATKIIQDRRSEWVKRFIGNINQGSAKRIAEDIRA